MDNVVTFKETHTEDKINEKINKYYQDLIKWQEREALRRKAKRQAWEEYRSFEALRAF